MASGRHFLYFGEKNILLLELNANSVPKNSLNKSSKHSAKHRFQTPERPSDLTLPLFSACFLADCGLPNPPAPRHPGTTSRGDLSHKNLSRCAKPPLYDDLHAPYRDLRAPCHDRTYHDHIGRPHYAPPLSLSHSHQVTTPHHRLLSPP
ncbi:hypothetical protein ACSQ67_024623 [Phaseolus vulgaris]